MRGIFLILSLLIFSQVKAATVVHFQGADNHQVCKLLNGVSFIVSQTQIDDFTVATQRVFSTQNKNFIMACNQKRSLGSLYYFYEEATLFFDPQIGSPGTFITENATHTKVAIQLTKSNEVELLSDQAMHDIPFETFEKIGNDFRLHIDCQYQPGTDVATSCTIQAIEN